MSKHCERSRLAAAAEERRWCGSEVRGPPRNGMAWRGPKLGILLRLSRPQV